MTERYGKSAAEILRKIGCTHLRLYRGKGYWYFVYDTLDGADSNGLYDDEMVYVMRLNDMTLERWIETGTNFVNRMEGK